MRLSLTNLQYEISSFYHPCLTFNLGVWHSYTWCHCKKIGRSNRSEILMRLSLTNLQNGISAFYQLCLIFNLDVWHSYTWYHCKKIGSSNQPSRIWILQKNALTIFNSFKCQYHKSLPVQLQQKIYNNALNIKQLCQLQLN
jgi:hypothetical protein